MLNTRNLPVFIIYVETDVYDKFKQQETIKITRKIHTIKRSLTFTQNGHQDLLKMTTLWSFSNCVTLSAAFISLCFLFNM
jgi:hypothetical protein